jgi:hypothetical protein
MKPIHKFILVGFMALSAGTFIFGVLQLAGPPVKNAEQTPASGISTNMPGAEPVRN